MDCVCQRGVSFSLLLCPLLFVYVVKRPLLTAFVDSVYRHCTNYVVFIHEQTMSAAPAVVFFGAVQANEQARAPNMLSFEGAPSLPS